MRVAVVLAVLAGCEKTPRVAEPVVVDAPMVTAKVLAPDASVVVATPDAPPAPADALSAEDYANMLASAEDEPPGPNDLGSLSDPALNRSDLRPDAVRARIRTTYLANLVRCFRQTRAGSGRVTLRFTVYDRGTVGNFRARSDAKELDACLVTEMKTWTFPRPKNSAGKPTAATFELSFDLETP